MPRTGYIKADNELNAVYKEIMKTSSPELRDKLKQAQMAWLKYRDTSLALMIEHEKDSGSFGSLVVAKYKADMVEKRVLELRHVFSGPDSEPVEGW